MGQSASSPNHANSDQNQPQQPIPERTRAGHNEDSITRALNVLTNDHGPGRSQRRRRSLSPDTELQRRSGRLRRRLSRLVPSAISSSPIRCSNDLNDDRDSATNTQGPPTSSTRSSSSLRLNPRSSSRISRPRSPNTLIAHPTFRPISTLAPRIRNFSTPLPRPLSTPSPLNLNLNGMPTSDSSRYADWEQGEGHGSGMHSFDGEAPIPSTTGYETSGTPQRRSRLSRLRNSLTPGSNLPNLWAEEQNQNIAPEDHQMSDSPIRPNGIEPLSNLDVPSPSFSLPRRNSDFDPAARAGSSSQSPRDHVISRARPGEDQAAMLSRLLSVAATATAASLVGSMDQAMTEARDVAGDSADGSFESFLRALQNGRLAAALRNGGNELGERIDEGNSNTSDLALNEGGGGGMTAPLNFFRMFRFGSGSRPNGNNNNINNNISSSNNNNAGVDNPDGSAANGEATSRMVPVIIVGIRSVMPRENAQQDNQAAPHLFDALANLPRSNNSARQGQGPSSPPGLARQYGRDTGDSSQGDGFGSNAELNALPEDDGADMFPEEPFMDGSRRYSPSPQPSPNGMGAPPLGPLPALPPISDLLSGSALRDYHSRRRRSVSSPNTHNTSSPPPRPGRFSFRRSESDDGGEDYIGRRGSRSPESERRSDRAHRRASRSGSDRGPSSPEGTRSWIIYVLGGSYPENHPILTTPSLFTDTPTYEDMMLLSSLLGPAKPPVATQEDVDSAGGIFVVGSPEGEGEIQVGDRCLVCLSDFEQGEHCRRLVKCQHLFHRECIDEWLTTGRNSCPLCRAQGVNEQKSANQDSPTRGDEASVEPAQ